MSANPAIEVRRGAQLVADHRHEVVLDPVCLLGEPDHLALPLTTVPRDGKSPDDTCHAHRREEVGQHLCDSELVKHPSLFIG